MYVYLDLCLFLYVSKDIEKCELIPILSNPTQYYRGRKKRTEGKVKKKSRRKGRQEGREGKGRKGQETEGQKKEKVIESEGKMEEKKNKRKENSDI